MQWLIYSHSPADRLPAAAGVFLGTVHAPDRSEAQRRASQGFFCSLTTDGEKLVPCLAMLGCNNAQRFWPILVPSGKAGSLRTTARLEAYFRVASFAMPQKPLDARDATIMLRMEYMRRELKLRPAQRIYIEEEAE